VGGGEEGREERAYGFIDEIAIITISGESLYVTIGGAFGFFLFPPHRLTRRHFSSTAVFATAVSLTNVLLH